MHLYCNTYTIIVFVQFILLVLFIIIANAFIVQVDKILYDTYIVSL